jgi:hypothetical protein
VEEERARGVANRGRRQRQRRAARPAERRAVRARRGRERAAAKDHRDAVWRARDAALNLRRELCERGRRRPRALAPSRARRAARGPARRRGTSRGSCARRLPARRRGRSGHRLHSAPLAMALLPSRCGSKGAAVEGGGHRRAASG